MLCGSVGDKGPRGLQVTGDRQVLAEHNLRAGRGFVFDDASVGVVSAQERTEALQRPHAVIEVTERQCDADWGRDVQAEEVHIRELDIAPGSQAQIDRVQDRGLAAVARANQAVDARRRAPSQQLDAAEVGDLDFSDSCHAYPRALKPLY